MGITGIAIKRPVSAVMLILAILMVGISSLFGFSLELFPETEMPVLMVHTFYEGTNPETIDSNVSRVIEETAETLNGIDTIGTYSYENYSMVLLRYQYGTDPMSNYLKLQNALAEVKKTLPDGCGEPVIIEMNAETKPSVQISASAEDEKEVLAFLQEGMLAQLEHLPSVAKVEVYGGESNYIRVELKQELLKQYGLDMGAVANAITSANFSIPIGTVEQGRQNLGVTSAAKISSLQEMKDIPLRTDSEGLIRLEDIAEIAWSVKDAGSISRMNGSENVTISITKSQRHDAMTLSKQVEEVISAYENDTVAFEMIYDGGDEILTSSKNLAIAILSGTLLAIAVMMLLWGDWRTAVCVSGALVLSMLGTLTGMRWCGYSLNMLTMGAMIIAIGILLDTAIVVMETFFKLADSFEDRKALVLEGTKSVKSAVITAVAATVAICLPLILLQGFSEKLLEPFGFVVIFTAIAAFFEAAIFLPLLFLVLKPKERSEMRLLSKIQQWYENIVPKLIGKKEKVIAVAMLLFAISCAAVIYTDRELISPTDTGIINVEVEFRHGMKVEEIEKKLIVLEELITESDEVESYSTTVADSTANLRICLKKDSGTSGEEFREMLKKRTKDYVGIDINVSNGSLLSSLETPDGEMVVLSGYRLDELKLAARELADRYRSIPGVLSVLSDAETEGTKLEINVDSMRAANYGLTPGQVAERMQELSGGREVLKIEEEGREYSVLLEYPEGLYDTPQNLMNAGIEAPDGSMVLLAEIASLEYTDAQSCIARRDGKYIIEMTVTCPEKYRDDVRSGMEKAWNKLQTQAGVYREKTTAQQLTERELKRFCVLIASAVLLLFFVLTVRFETVKHALTMILSIPLGLFGAFLLVFLSGSSWNMASLIGVLFLIELIVCQGIRYTENMERLIPVMTLEEALLESGKQLLRPIMVTMAAVIALMLPAAIWPGAGTSLMRGMAVVMIGGSISGALLIVLLLPVFYSFLYGKEEDTEVVEMYEISDDKPEEKIDTE